MDLTNNGIIDSHQERKNVISDSLNKKRISASGGHDHSDHFHSVQSFLRSLSSKNQFLFVGI